jgi:hypothetical protein
MGIEQYQEFSLGEVLTITTGHLLCEMNGVYRILNFITADTLYTHQLPRAMQESSSWLLAQFPELTDIDTSSITPTNWETFLAGQIEKFGPTRNVPRMPDDCHQRIHPIQEAVMTGEAIPIVKGD